MVVLRFTVGVWRRQSLRAAQAWPMPLRAATVPGRSSSHKTRPPRPRERLVIRLLIEFFRRETGVCERRPPRLERPRLDEPREELDDDERLERLLEERVEELEPLIVISSNNIYDSRSLRCPFRTIPRSLIRRSFLIRGRPHLFEDVQTSVIHLPIKAIPF